VVKQTTVLLLLLVLVGAARAADSLNVRLVSDYDTPGQACGVAVNGDYVYVAGQDSGLRVISVADPAHPVEVGYLITPGAAYGVAVNEQNAYVADDTAGLRIISVADPAQPHELGACRRTQIL